MLACCVDGQWENRIQDCECVEIINAMKKVKNSGLEKAVENYRFDNFFTDSQWQEKLKKAAEAFAANPEGWFFVGGQSGAGKTHVCTAICASLLRRGQDVIYCQWRPESVKLKGCINESDEYCNLIAKYKKARVLYIDDLFKGANTKGPTTADIGILFEILNHRYLNDMTTIISSEYLITEIIEFDEAVGSRIAEKSRDYLISISKSREKNYRLKKLNEII